MNKSNLLAKIAISGGIAAGILGMHMGIAAADPIGPGFVGPLMSSLHISANTVVVLGGCEL